MLGPLVEEGDAWPNASGHSADETGVEPIREPAEDAAGSASRRSIARPNSYQWPNGRISRRRTATGSSAAHDATERAARISATDAAAEYAGTNGTQSGSAAHAGETI